MIDGEHDDADRPEGNADYAICEAGAQLPQRSECRWPAWAKGAEPDHRYCCDQVAPGKPYCAQHMALAYRRRRVSAPHEA